MFWTTTGELLEEIESKKVILNVADKYEWQWVHDLDKELINKWALENTWHICTKFSTYMDDEPYGRVEIFGWKIPLSTAMSNEKDFALDINGNVRIKLSRKRK